MRWIPRLGVLAAVVAAALLIASPASAVDDNAVTLRQSNVTAFGSGTHECTLASTSLQSADRDAWVFVLPGNGGDFVSLSLTYFDGSSNVTVTIPDSGAYRSRIVTDNGTGKAWVALPAGWKLVTGTATITGTTPQEYFNLTHTCPASGSTGGSGGGSGGETITTPGTGPSSPGAAGPQLPITGFPAVVAAVVGAMTIAAGVVLLVLYRRRGSIRFTA